mmetsp:Transcript_80524/g.167815  ORF Transcript_80524/g.167815 Transcript_80524/m.167815 type:complete len:126 (+) Transcript_80524:258-635(+)|eukprot:CAMPEP_0206431210 /NCGR_PEP_ID=MMETSP0324_2-20121206/7239_1 /ASSEMBLY_ACC=CAM_ASM_000836 /TAXON_ID=2866 /ORGANISM="Crypthecodinium cohnii, Strain Seligo" /LENGTH=125 /DNA_ID=CAMNT_0053897115 /DNA_START=166 /DNA_END=543 /DNA_ORIENTATION=+
MGAAGCKTEVGCPCETQKGLEMKCDGREEPVLPEAFPILPKGHPYNVLERVQGRWRRHPDGQPMGEIRNGLVQWHEDFMHSASRLSLTPSGELQMDLVGQFYYGHVHAAGKSIHWSDGEIWVAEL